MSVAPTDGGGFSLSSTFGRIGSVGSSAAGAVSDLFAAEGDRAEAANYNEAAALALQNVEFSKQMTSIRETQAQREITQTIGAQGAAYAGGNIAESGTALDVLRSSAQQGAMQQYIIGAQGAAQESAYQEQATSYERMASAASSASLGSTIAGVIRGATALAGLV